MKEDTKKLKAFLDLHFAKEMRTIKPIEFSNTNLAFLGSLFL